MAYHLHSLVRVIELILCHEQQHKYFDDNNTTPQLRSLLEKACFLRDSFENHPILSHECASGLEDQIQDAAENAEDVLETYVYDFQKEDEVPNPDLQNLLDKLDSAKDEMMKLILDGDQIKKETMKLMDGDPISADKAPPALSRIDQNPENIVVGFEEDILRLKNRVFGESSKLEIIPIVGMGGIGKTTLARKIYDGSSDDFDVRAWATVSDDYSLRDILLALLGHKRGEMMETKDESLGVLLHQRLMGRRYLIVLDDIWRSKAWDAVKKFFPSENNISRIILTTRQSDVANYVDPTSPQHQVRPLGEADSWKLLKEKVFGEKDCLPELEEHGIRIAKSCGGLPLALQVVGGLLSHIERTENSWEQISRDVISAIPNKDEQISSILSLSYDRLPHCLKPCFLYLSAFPEDFDISASKLIRLWSADGFLKPSPGKSLEERAEEHINALIDRNLIFVSRRTMCGEVKFVRIHDLLRDLCLQKAHDKKFFHFLRDVEIDEDMSCARRLSVLRLRGTGKIDCSTTDRLLARSLISLDPFAIRGISPMVHKLQLTRVLDVLPQKRWNKLMDQYPGDILQMVNLRYLAMAFEKELHPGIITTCRNLQTLILESRVKSSNVSHEIFQLPHLREIVFIDCLFRCDFKECAGEKFVVQENLHTVEGLIISPNFEVVLAKFPNLKRLRVHYTGESVNSESLDLSCFQNLQKFDFHGNYSEGSGNFFMNLNFPMLLKKLKVRKIMLTETCMKTIGMLPNLEFLKLDCLCISETNSWKPSQGEFCRLRFLFLKFVDIVTWEADETHFPVLEHLKLDDCWNFQEIPLGIGNIPTLKLIQVIQSAPSIGDSAIKIKDEQFEFGESLLRVQVGMIKRR